ncbi:MAG TPA: AMP-binding protein [Streptosporangiaceae bacterium]|nr:AMP-binding protein [Streptosporangiaceae bacterium]
MPKLEDLIAEVSVTRRLVCVATDRARLTAFADGPAAGWSDSGHCTYASFAGIIQAAAAGLAWRGLRPRDVVGVMLPDAACFAIAVHAIRAAGGVPSPVDSGLCAAETAGQLAECGARMIITAPPLADSALAAADRSWVRQVFSFGDAPGTTHFAELLGLDTMRPVRSRQDDLAMLPFCRSLDGRLRPAPVTHAELVGQLDRVDQRAGITGSDIVLAGPPEGDGLAYALLLDCALLRGAAVVAAPRQNLAAACAAHRCTVAIVPYDAAAMLPDDVRVLAVD